jgi:hypothetical protein
MKLGLALVLMAIAPLAAAEFKSVKECVPGVAVQDRSNLRGKVVGVVNGLCRVKLDSEGKETSYLHWMLRAAGASAETDDQLKVGVYLCHVGEQAAGKLEITAPGSYVSDGKSGKYRVEPSRKIVFESGPFSEYHAKLLAGPKIGMNLNGSNFYGLTCDPAR